MSTWVEEYRARRAKEVEESIIKSHSMRAKILDLCRRHGVSEVHVDFDGSGDSGQIEGIYGRDANDDEIDLDEIASDVMAERSEWNPETREYETVVTDTPKTLESLIEDEVYRRLDQSGVDWYNNDGGFGHWTLKVNENQLDFEVRYRVTESELGDSEEGDFV